MTEGWGQGDSAANDYYKPLETFAERFGAFLQLVRDADFSAVDVWTGQLNWKWAQQEHLQQARKLLAEKGLTVASYAGSFGNSVEEFRSACAVAEALGTNVLGGNTSLLANDRAGLVAALEASGCKLAIENHPGDKRPQDILDKIGTDGRGLIGSAVDTGWFGTEGFNAANAIRALGKHVFYVHLKDVRAAGAHETCVLGDGIVPVFDCLTALHEVGYAGTISIEHEPEHEDPVPAVVASAERVQKWLAGRS